MYNTKINILNVMINLIIVLDIGYLSGVIIHKIQIIIN